MLNVTLTGGSLLPTVAMSWRAWSRALRLPSAADKRRERPAGRRPALIVSGDGGCVVAWHPTQLHPYEHSKPMPARQEAGTAAGLADQDNASESPLRRALLLADDLRSESTGPSQDDVAAMFVVPKDYFYSRWTVGKKRYASPQKIVPEKIRDGL